MTPTDSGRSAPTFHTVTNPGIAALLTDPAARRYFDPFLAQTRSVREAADECGCSLDAMLYRVRVFERAGLLTVVEVRPRKGRAIKAYRTAHDAYFVPHGVTPFATLEDRLYRGAEPGIRDWAQSTARVMQAKAIEGVRFYRNAEGVTWSEGVATADSMGGLDPQVLNDPRRTPRMDITTTLSLSESEARAVQAELVAVIEKWQPRLGVQRGQVFNLSLFFYQAERQESE